MEVREGISQSTPLVLSWAIYEYPLAEYQPAHLYFYVLDADYHVLLANYAKQRWDLIETVDSPDTDFPEEHVVSVPNWSDYYSPDMAIYVAVLSQQDGNLQAISIEDSRDAASRRFGLLNAAQDIYYGLGENYFGWLGTNHWFFDDYPFLLPVTAPPFDPYTGTLAMSVNAYGLPPKVQTAVGYTYTDGSSGVFERVTGDLDTDSQEASDLKSLFCQKILQAVFDAEQAYFTANFEYGSASQLNSPPAPQAPYLDDKYVVVEFGSGIVVQISNSSDGFTATATCDGSTFTIDQTGVIQQQ